MKVRSRSFQCCRTVFLIFIAALFSSAEVYPADIDPSGYETLAGERFFLLTDTCFTSDEQAVVRLEAPSREAAFSPYNGVDIVVYQVPDPVEFLKHQTNLHRPKVEGVYRGEGLSNALNYLWDVWYKKSRLSWQRIFSYTARKNVTAAAPELKQVPAHTYHTQFEDNPQFRHIEDFDFAEQFRYPIWDAKAIAPPEDLKLAGSSSDFIEPKEGNLYVPIGKRKPGLYFVEAMIGGFRANTLVFVSDTIAITKISSGQLLVWTVSKNTGLPSAGAKVLLTDGVGVLKSGVSNSDGILIIEKKNPERSYVIGEDARGGVFISENFYYDSEIYAAKIYSFTDRPLYKPGDTVYLKLMGLVFENAVKCSPLSPAEVHAVIIAPDGTPIISKSFETQAVAGGDTSFELPESAASGGYSVQLVYEGKKYAGSFRVAQYAKPHYDIEVLPGKENYKTGEAVKAKIKLTYPSGKPVDSGQIELTARTQKLSMVEGELKYLGLFPLKLLQQSYQASKEGIAEIELPAAQEPSRYILQIRSTDKSAYRVTAAKEILIEEGLTAVTVFAEKQFSKPGEAVRFALKSESSSPSPSVPASWESLRLEDQSAVSGKPDDSSGFSVKFGKSGSYTVTVKDASGFVLARTSHWVEGDELKSTPGSIAIVLDKEKYKAGETAHALITFSDKAETALATLERDKVEAFGVISKTHDWITLRRESDLQWKADIPVKPSYSPNMTFSLVYVQNGRYVFQNKGIQVEVPAVSIRFTADKEVYLPGDKADVEVKTTLDDKPIQANLTVSVVDEMIYVLQPEIAPEISEFFYHWRRNQVRTYSSLNFYNYDAAVSASGKNPGSSYHERPLKLRERPRRENIDTALWIPNLRTDASGTARFSFTVPDSLTRWRITGRAISDAGIVGQKRAFFRSSKDFYVKWTGPRVFRQKDQPKVNLVIFNMKDSPENVTLSAQGPGVLFKKDIALEPGSNYAAVDLKAEGSGMIKTSLFTGEELYDELETEISVVPGQWLTTKTESFEIKDETTFKIPENAFNVRMSVSAGLSDEFLNIADRLIDYPYGCVEQTASRLIPLTMAFQSVSQLGLSEPTTRRIRNIVAQNRLRLVQMAGPSAVFGWWGDLSDGDSPFMTAYSYYADRNACRVLGFELPDSHWQNLLEVYKNFSGSETFFTQALILWLANEIGLPARTLIQGWIEAAEDIKVTETRDNINFMGYSYVMTEPADDLRVSLAIYLIRIAASDLKMSLSDKFNGLAYIAEKNLSRSSSPLAKALLILGKSQFGAEGRYNLRQILSDLGSEMPTVDRSLALIFLNKAVKLTDSSISSSDIRLGKNWQKSESHLGRPLWYYKGTGKEDKVVVNQAAPEGVYARLVYESYGKEVHQLPVEIERKLYRLKRRDKSSKFEAVPVTEEEKEEQQPWMEDEEKFDAIPVKSAEEVNAFDLYLDEIRLTPKKNENFRYGIIEVPLPPGADVESMTWNIAIPELIKDDEEGLGLIEEPGHIPGDLFYSIPLESLEESTVFRHLIRFSQTGTFNIPRVRYFRMYAPGDKAFEQKNSPEFRTVSVGNK